MLVRYFILFFLFTEIAFSQTDVSALFQKLSVAKSDTTRCNLLIQIAESLYYSRPDTVEPICEDVIKIVDAALPKANAPERKAFLIAKGSALTDLGVLAGRKGNYDKEINYYLESIRIQQLAENKIGLASSYNNLGFVYSHIGDIQKAIEYSFKALKIQEETDEKEGQALSLNNIGYNFRLLGEYSKALEYYTRSLKIHRAIKNDAGEAMTLINIANIYEKNGIKSCSLPEKECLREGQIKALEMYKQSYAIQEKINDKLGMAYALNNIAISYKNLGDPSEKEEKLKSAKGRQLALSYFEQSMSLHKSIGNKRGVAYVTDNIAGLYLLEKQDGKALEYAIVSYQLAHELGEPEIIQRAAGTLKQIYHLQKKHRQAFEMFEVETRMKDSLMNEENKKVLFQKSVQYTFEKKALADSLRNAEEIRLADLKLQKEVATKNTLIITIAAVAIIVIVLTVLLFLLNRSIQQRKKAYTLLEEKNLEIQRQSEKLVKLSREITRYQTQMNPHFIFNALNSIQGFVLSDQKNKSLMQIQNFAKLMRQTLNNSANDAIKLSQEIEFLKLYVEFESLRYPCKVAFIVETDCDTEDVLIPPMLIQPLIENSLKHGGFHELKNPTIALHIATLNNLLQIEVKDNGIGFKQNVADVFANSHALGILKSRLILIFESEDTELPADLIRIHSNDAYLPVGTSIIFKIPLITKY